MDAHQLTLGRKPRPSASPARLPARRPALTLSVAKLPPPPSSMHFLPKLTSKEPLEPPADGDAATLNEDEPGGPLTPSSNETFEIKRCDLMWSANSNTHADAFTPVESCEIQPVVILAFGSDRFDDDDLEGRQTGLQVHYRWTRGPARAVCFFHPHRVAQLQCTVTLRCFCSYECFGRGHVQLRRFYVSSGKYPVPRQGNEFTYGVPCRKLSPLKFDRYREVDETHHKLLRQAGLVVEPGREQWPVISYKRNYSPRREDVGHQLRFECFVCSTGGMMRVLTSEAQSSPLQTQQRPKRLRPAPEPESEHKFWLNFDAMLAENRVDVDRYRVVVTGCVVPQAQLSEDRCLVPVGLLSLLTSAAECANTPQRVIIPGTPLAEALGIGVIPDRQHSHKTVKRNSTRALSDSIAWQTLSQKIERHKRAIKDKRISLLTENAFAAWTKAPTNDSHKHKTALASNPRSRVNHSQSLKPGGGSVTTESGEGFSVMTWNVLADIYATVEAYPYSEPYVLAWNYRRDRILAEIVAYSPDIICLQEVQGDHFEDFFAPALLRRGYEGLYKQKTSKVFRGSGKHRGGKYVCDGCATFFRVPKFHLVDHFGIEFARVAPPASRGNTKADKRLNKDNVALVLCLEQQMAINRNDKDGVTRRVVVANTHILANPEAPDVKIWQANTLTSVLTEYLDKTVAFNHVESNSRPPGLVVCGDFNSTPNSAVYQLVTSGKCDARHEELQSSDVYRWLHEIPLGHGLNLRSSYGVANYSRIEAERAMASGNAPSSTASYMLNYFMFEPEFTNYTHQFVGCLDYIFFDDRVLKVTGTLDLVKEIQLMEEAHALQLSDWALPSPQRPSDHTPLLSRFDWAR